MRILILLALISTLLVKQRHMPFILIKLVASVTLLELIAKIHLKERTLQHTQTEEFTDTQQDNTLICRRMVGMKVKSTTMISKLAAPLVLQDTLLKWFGKELLNLDVDSQTWTNLNMLFVDTMDLEIGSVDTLKMSGA